MVTGRPNAIWVELLLATLRDECCKCSRVIEVIAGVGCSLHMVRTRFSRRLAFRETGREHGGVCSLTAFADSASYVDLAPVDEGRLRCYPKSCA